MWPLYKFCITESISSILTKTQKYVLLYFGGKGSLMSIVFSIYLYHTCSDGNMLKNLIWRLELTSRSEMWFLNFLSWWCKIVIIYYMVNFLLGKCLTLFYEYYTNHSRNARSISNYSNCENCELSTKFVLQKVFLQYSQRLKNTFAIFWQKKESWHQFFQWTRIMLPMMVICSKT